MYTEEVCWKTHAHSQIIFTKGYFNWVNRADAWVGMLWNTLTAMGAFVARRKQRTKSTEVACKKTIVIIKIISIGWRGMVALRHQWNVNR